MKRDRRGNMPFAIIAVTLLVMSGACAAAMAGYERSSENADELREETESVEAAVDGITAHVNRGLGEIIRSVSTDPALGGMDRRVSEFDRRAKSWLENQFPVSDNGSVARLVSHDVRLMAESLQMVSDDELAGGYVPAYLRGIGSVDVVLESPNGRSTRSLDISTDGSYALPLSMEQGSLFDNMTDGGGISVSQMMSYQLTSLAQHRVLNGYGALEEHGRKGTSAILTDDDVLKAYRNAVDAIGLICFRTPTGELGMSGSIDLSDALVSDGGQVTVDLATVYSQGLMGVVDDVALKWFEYFCGDRILDWDSQDRDSYRLLSDMVLSFMRGESVMGAESYIREVMDSNGIPESVYRHPGSGTTTGTVGGHTVTVENPTADLFEQGWIKKFKSHYHKDGNYVMDLMRSVLRDAAVKVGESKGLGTVTVPIDPYDGESFTESIRKALDRPLSECEAAISGTVSESLRASGFSDPFYGAIADRIVEKSDTLVLRQSFEDRLEEELSRNVDDEDELAILMGSEDARRMVDSYIREVHRDLAEFDRLRDVPGGQPGPIKDILSSFCAIGMGGLSVLAPVEERIRGMLNEMSGIDGTNPHAGITDLPGTEDFRIRDDDGNTTVERLDVELSSDPVALHPSVLESKCVHMTDFRLDVGAAYSTVFGIALSDSIAYSVDGIGTLAQAMGTVSASMTGVSDPDISLEIAVASAWPLAGVEYSPSRTVVDDAVAEALEILEPIIEPLREVMEAVREAMTAIAESLVEIGRHVAEILMRVYDRVMGPIERINSWIMENIEMLVSEGALAVFFEIGLDNQSISFEYFGYRFDLVTSAVSWNASTKTLFTATLSGPVAGLLVSAGITAKVRGDAHRENLIITGEGSVTGDDWDVRMKLDPLMKGGRYLLVTEGEVRGTDISVVVPELEDYHEFGVSLRDIEGIGHVLDNIPLPIPGTKASVDAGFSLKYSAPLQTGLLVNEFESNPAGEDSDGEWVELMNNTSQTIDLDGYTLSASSDWRKKTMDLSGTISPGEYLVVEPDFQLVNDSGKYTKKGEAVVLKDPEGNTVDKTPTLKDVSNDGSSWQRRFDGSTEWVFQKSTQGVGNGSSVLEEMLPAADLKNLVWDSVEAAFGDIGTITDAESAERFLESLVHHVLDRVIKRFSAQIVEASVFVKVDVQDVSGSASTGVRVALRADSQLAGDVLRYVAGELQTLLLGVENPYSIDPTGMFTENIDLDVTFHTGMSFPRLLSEGIDDLPEMDLGVTFRTNLAAISNLLGTDAGRPELVCGIRVLDCPIAVIPDRLSPNANMEHDLWLMRMTVRWS